MLSIGPLSSLAVESILIAVWLVILRLLRKTTFMQVEPKNRSDSESAEQSIESLPEVSCGTSTDKRW